MGDSDASYTSESEEQQLRSSLKMYKDLNRDLSQRNQDLKMELKTTTKELTRVRAELLEEKAKNSPLRRYMGLVNYHCTNFVNNYVTTVQQMHDDGIEIGVAANLSNVREQFNDVSSGTRAPRVRQRPSLAAIQNRLNPDLDPLATSEEQQGGADLNTILEESPHHGTLLPNVSKLTHDLNNNSYQENDSNAEDDKDGERTFVVSAGGNIDEETESVYSNGEEEDKQLDSTVVAATDDNNSERNESDTEDEDERQIARGEKTGETSYQLEEGRKLKDSSADLTRVRDSEFQLSDSATHWAHNESATVSNSKVDNRSKDRKRKIVTAESTRPKRKARPSSESLKDRSLNQKLRRAK